MTFTPFDETPYGVRLNEQIDREAAVLFDPRNGRTMPLYLWYLESTPDYDGDIRIAANTPGEAWKMAPGPGPGVGIFELCDGRAWFGAGLTLSQIRARLRRACEPLPILARSAWLVSR